MNIFIHFVGTRAIAETQQLIENHLPESCYLSTYRIPHEEALAIGKSAHVLFYPAWKGYHGVYSAKIFEYIGLRKNILICPGDDNVIDSLVLECKAGVICNDRTHAEEIIIDWYKEFTEAKAIKYYGDETLIRKYSSRGQIEQLIDCLPSHH